MGISAIGSNVVQNVNFSGKKHSRENIDRFLEASDRDLLIASQQKAIKNFEQRRRNNHNLLLSIPIIAGLSDAILTDGNTRFLTKEVSGRAAKLANGIKTGTKWGLALATVGIVNGIMNMVSKKSESVADFRKEHHNWALLGDLAMMFGINAAITSGAKAVANNVKSETVANVAKKVGTAADFINGIHLPKFVQNAKKTVGKYVPEMIKPSNLIAKTPEFVKSTGKSMVAWAPYVAIASLFVNSIRNVSKTTSEVTNNYVELKNKQAKLRQARIREMAESPVI